MKKFIVMMAIIATAVVAGMAIAFNFRKSINETLEAEVVKTEVYVLVNDVQNDVTMSANFGTPDANHVMVRDYKANGYTLTKEVVNGEVVRVWIKKYRSIEIDITAMVL